MEPKKTNLELMKTLSKVSNDLGYGIVSGLDPTRRGAADTSDVADLVPAIDGLGLLGSGAHSTEERISLSEVPKIMKRSALFIYRLLQAPAR